MRRVGIFEAKTHFSALIDAVADGETVTITRNGDPVAQLVPLQDGTRDAAAAMERILNTKGKLRGLTIRDLVDGGRRH